MPFSVSKFSRLFRVSTHAKSLSFALLFIRGVAGGAFILHGLNKVTHPFDWMGPTAEVPGFLQLLAAVAEFGGGIAWVVGLFFPLACIGIIATMIGAVLTQAFILRDPFVNLGSRNSYELAVVYLAVAALLAVTGPGTFSADSRWFGSSPEA